MLNVNVCIAARCEQECDVSECGGSLIPPPLLLLAPILCLLFLFSSFLSAITLFCLSFLLQLQVLQLF